jgi:uncharacterized protein (DUF433 family)
MESLNRMAISPGRMNGQPCIRNLSLSVQRVILLLATYPDRQTIRSWSLKTSGRL